MQTHFLKWRKGLFSTTYNIYKNNQLIGTLTDKTFSQTSFGEINNKKYIFRTNGFLKQNTDIIDRKENKIIGKITYSNWMTKATLKLNDKLASWKYDNVWNTKWRIFDSTGAEIKYSGTSGGGAIETNTDDGLLIISGLFVTNYYWQMSISVIVAAMIPIWITIFH